MMPNWASSSLLNLLDFKGFVKSKIVEEDSEKSPSKSVFNSAVLKLKACINAFRR